MIGGMSWGLKLDRGEQGVTLWLLYHVSLARLSVTYIISQVVALEVLLKATVCGNGGRWFSLFTTLWPSAESAAPGNACIYTQRRNTRTND